MEVDDGQPRSASSSSSSMMPPPPAPLTTGHTTTTAAAGDAESPTDSQPGAAQGVMTNAPPEMDDEERETIDQLLTSLEDFVPAIPDEVVNFYLTKTGFMCSDEKIRRLISLAAQKFISDIAQDALQYCKVRQQSPAYRDKRGKGQRLVLTMEDLSQALREYGITVKKPDYFVDKNPHTAATAPSHPVTTPSSATAADKKKKPRTK